MTDKPIVHYCGKARIKDGRAWLYPIDHPAHLWVTNTCLVSTSKVLSLKAGRIETLNTIYLHAEGDDRSWFNPETVL